MVAKKIIVKGTKKFFTVKGTKNKVLVQLKKDVCVNEHLRLAFFSK
jgi:hypothetical protein